MKHAKFFNKKKDSKKIDSSSNNSSAEFPHLMAEFKGLYNFNKSTIEVNPRIEELKNRAFVRTSEIESKPLKDAEKRLLVFIPRKTSITGAQLLEEFQDLTDQLKKDYYDNGGILNVTSLLGMGFPILSKLSEVENTINSLPELLDSLVQKGIISEMPSVENTIAKGPGR